MNQQPAQPGLFIGMDWADQKHDVYVIDRNGKGVHRVLEHSAENIEAWVGDMLKLAGGQPIAIMLEQSRGALIYALMFREDVLLYYNSRQTKTQELLDQDTITQEAGVVPSVSGSRGS